MAGEKKLEKFDEFVRKKTRDYLLEKIPPPQRLNRSAVEQKTNELALQEMRRFKREHDRLPNRQELEQMAEAVYMQVKGTAQKKVNRKQGPRRSLLEERKKRREQRDIGEEPEPKKTGPQNIAQQRREKRRRHEKDDDAKKEEFEEESESGENGSQSPQSATGLTQKELEGMNVSDIFEGEKEGEKGLEVEDIVGEEDLDSIEKELAGITDDSDSVSKEVSTDNSRCPNCKNFAHDLVFCPECGTAFCTHCAKKIVNQKEHTLFTCPKCNAEFKSKKIPG